MTYFEREKEEGCMQVRKRRKKGEANASGESVIRRRERGRVIVAPKCVWFRIQF